MRRIALPLTLFLAVFAHQSARAHSVSTSFVMIDAPSERAPVGLRWDLPLHDLVWTVFIDRDFDGVASVREIQEARGTIDSAVLGQIAVRRGGEICRLNIEGAQLARRLEQDFLSVALRADCPRPGLLALDGGLFMSGDPSQRVLLRVSRGGESLSGVIGSGAARWEEPARTSAWASFVRFVGEGIWHVAIGYDHIAFVLLLLLPSVLTSVDGKWQGATRLPQVARDIVTIVTAFTIAHSTTLALAVTGTVHVPTQPIEVAIAASIAVAGGINLLPRLSRVRLPLAFGFGFVHGFGFANALGEIDASGAALLPLLAGFNLGVEIAQLCIVAMVLPLIYMARRQSWYAGGVMPLGSCALGAAGIVWLLQRL